MKHIEIKTSDRIDIQFNLADLKDRGLAFLLDAVILYALLFIQIITSLAIFGDRNMDYAFFIFIIPTFLFYSLISELLLGGQSLGKMAIGIRVVKLNGQYAGLQEYLIRWLFRWIDIWLSSFVIGSILISSSQHAQRLGDLLAGTTLIKVKASSNVQLKDLLNIHKEEDYKISYPQVTMLKDEDMVLIKKTLIRRKKYNNEVHNQLIRDLSERLKNELKIHDYKEGDEKFLNLLIKDYVIATR